MNEPLSTAALPAALTDALRDLVGFAAAQGMRLWLVGGAVRDLVRGQVPLDLDLAVDGDGFGLARAYADAHGAAFVPLDAERATGRVVLPGAPPLTLDLAGLRGPSIEADLGLRDVTINALALELAAPPAPLFGLLSDPTGGRADLQAGRLRACGPTSLLADPLRVLRVARLGAQLDFQVDPALLPLMQAAVPGLTGVARERVRDELLRLLDAPRTASWLRLLDQVGALTSIFPELEAARDCEQPRVHFLPVLAHSLETVAALDWLIAVIRAQAAHNAADLGFAEADLPVAVQTVPSLSRAVPYLSELAALLDERRPGGFRRSALLKLAGLLHDNAKPQTKVQHPDGTITFYGHQDQGAERMVLIGQRLRLARQDAGLVTLIVREHMRPGQLRSSGPPTPRALVRLFRDLGAATPEVLIHELADHLASRGPHIDPDGWTAHLAWFGAILASFYTPAPQSVAPLLNGHDLIEVLGLTPGPALGALLREIAEAQAAGEITSREDALALARALM